MDLGAAVGLVGGGGGGGGFGEFGGDGGGVVVGGGEGGEESVEGVEVVVVGGGGEGFFDLVIAGDHNGVVRLHEGKGFCRGLGLASAAGVPLLVPGLKVGVGEGSSLEG